MASRDAIISALDTYLDASRFSDYCPNGLQIEGAKRVRHVVTGVSISQQLIDRAVASKAQMIVVHHGIFWRDDSPVLTGHHKARIESLLRADLTLLGYHLPLDAHPTLGNNAQILKRLGGKKRQPFGDYKGVAIGCSGVLPKATSVADLIKRLGAPAPMLLGGKMTSRVRTVAVVSGGAGSLFPQAVERGFDLYVTGEPWESAQAIARERGTLFLALGHYNSEKPGVMALADWLRKRFRVDAEFVDLPNPA